MNKEEVMKLGVVRAQKSMMKNEGGPFGATITKDGKIICVVNNTVLKDKDPTAHAEINAIREASKILGTHDLSGCELYATGYPCPMCLGAIIWANIKTVYYGCTPKDADYIGFRDDFIYDFINEGCIDTNVMTLEEVNRDSCLVLFDNYNKNKKQMY